MNKCLLYVVVLCLGATAFADPFSFASRSNRLGNADSYGYARMVRELGQLPVGGRVEFPMRLVFNTNPRIAPGAFGPNWRIPLIASTVVQYNQYKLYWDGPDEHRHFFRLDRDAKSRRGEAVFMERGKEWTATVSRRGEILIKAIEKEGWYYRYKDGQLQEFQFGEGSSACKITYSGRGLPLYITAVSSNDRIFEIEYRGSTDPTRILIGDRQILIEMGDADLTAPDGTTNYRNYRFSFLRTLDFGDGLRETYEYSKASKRSRNVPIFNPLGVVAGQKSLDLAVNHMQVSGKDSEDGSWLEWEAQSGFVTADSGASYVVENKTWDPHAVSEETKPGVTPKSVSIRRLPLEGDESQWSYAWGSGVKVYTDLATGVLVRSTRIMANGPSNMKLRKREEFVDGKWTVVRLNSYDPQGRIIRSTFGDSMSWWQWEDSAEGSTSMEYLNGALRRRSVYGGGDDLTERDIYSGNGDVSQYRYGEQDGLKWITHSLNGEAVSHKEMHPDGRLARMEWANGKEQFWTYDGGGKQMLTIYEDGRRYLINKDLGDLKFTEVTSTELVSSFVDALTQTRK